MKLEGSIAIFEAARHFSPFWSRTIYFIPPSYFLKIQFNIILLTMPRSPKCSLPLTFSQQTLYAPLPPYVLHPHAFLSSWSDHPNKIWWEVHIIHILFMLSTPLSCYLVHLRPKYIPEHFVVYCTGKFQSSVLISIVWGRFWNKNVKLAFCEWVGGQVGVGSYRGKRKEILLYKWTVGCCVTPNGRTSIPSFCFALSFIDHKIYIS
jgi:hypothetical protein